MSKQPDNHIDNILLDYSNRLLDVVINKENPTIGELIETPKRQIEDFYRNKIPTPPRQASELYPQDYVDGYVQAIDDITAQFNSKGDNQNG